MRSRGTPLTTTTTTLTAPLTGYELPSEIEGSAADGLIDAFDSVGVEDDQRLVIRLFFPRIDTAATAASSPPTVRLFSLIPAT